VVDEAILGYEGFDIGNIVEKIKAGAIAWSMIKTV